MNYVLSDIHGNRQRFDSIMEQIALQPEDTLYVLGDVIDRYPDGIRILRQLMKMPNVKMLLGNHEYMMLDALYHHRDEPADDFAAQYQQERRLALWYRNSGNITHGYLKHLRKTVRAEIFAYLDALPLNISLTVNETDYLLVHGGAVCQYEERGWRGPSFRDVREFAVWSRYKAYEEGPPGKTVIFGHTPTNHYQDGEALRIWKGNRLIGIDCGAGWPQGRLACLRLEDGREFYSKEADT